MKSLLRSSNSNGAFSDAIRDLVIVIVGILAALWLESWWQDLEDRKTEQDILQNLRSEFSRNRDDIALKVQYWSRTISEIRGIHALMGDPASEQVIAEFRNLHESQVPVEIADGVSVAKGYFFDPRFGQLTSVINSGQLGLIRNANLRAQIADWPSLVKDMDLERQIFVNLSSRRAAFELPNWPDSAFDTDYESLIANSRYDDWLYAMADNMERMHAEGLVVLEAAEVITTMIDDHLVD